VFCDVEPGTGLIDDMEAIATLARSHGCLCSRTGGKTRADYSPAVPAPSGLRLPARELMVHRAPRRRVDRERALVPDVSSCTRPADRLVPGIQGARERGLPELRYLRISNNALSRSISPNREFRQIPCFNLEERLGLRSKASV
jgi:hypothetical protein